MGGGGGGVESKFSVQLRPKLNNWVERSKSKLLVIIIMMFEKLYLCDFYSVSCIIIRILMTGQYFSKSIKPVPAYSSLRVESLL